MLIEIKVIPGARVEQIKIEAGLMKIYLRAKAVDNQANRALVDFLSDYYEVPKSAITIVKGLKSRLKTVNIEKL